MINDAQVIPFLLVQKVEESSVDFGLQPGLEFFVNLHSLIFMRS